MKMQVYSATEKIAGEDVTISVQFRSDDVAIKDKKTACIRLLQLVAQEIEADNQ